MSSETDASSGGFGFTWGETEDVLWLRDDEGNFKRIHPELLESLRAVAEEGRPLEDLPADQLDAVETLREEGYLRADRPVSRVPPPEGIALWPRVGAFLLAFGVLAAITIARWDVAWPPPADPRVNLWAVPFFFAAALLHELGHYAAAKPYFDAKIGFGLLNGIFPALVTRTTGAWACPRSVRIWISIAGPLVDVALTLVLAAIHLLWAPGVGILSTLVLVQFLRIAFVFNPLLDGDGYWLLVDATGAVNLRSRGFRDLKNLRPTRAAVFSLGVALFTAICAGVGLAVVGRMFGVV